MKFNWEAFKTKKIGVHLKTKEESDNFLEEAKKQGLNIDDVFWDTYKQYTCYRCSWKTNDLYYGSISYYIDNTYRIIEWSNHMKKEFTKDDLKPFMLVVMRDGRIKMVTDETFSDKCGNYNSICNYNENLENKMDRQFDIMKIYSRPESKTDYLSFDLSRRGEPIWERKEVEEMTLSEIEKILGKKIKIISEE